MAWRVMMPKKISMFSQEQLTGVKCKVIRLFSVSRAGGPRGAL
jgi:hypothetical protein